MPKKAFFDFENERDLSTPRGFEYVKGVRGKELRLTVGRARGQKSVTLQDPRKDPYRDIFWAAASDAYCNILEGMEGKGAEIFAVLAISGTMPEGENIAGVELRGANGKGFTFQFTFSASLSRVVLTDTLNAIVKQASPAGGIIAYAVPTALRLRVDNTGANQVLSAKVWKYYAEPEPESWWHTGVNVQQMGAITQAAVFIREHRRDPTLPGPQYPYAQQVSMDKVSAVELVTGLEFAETEAGGRRLVPVAKW